MRVPWCVCTPRAGNENIDLHLHLIFLFSPLLRSQQLDLLICQRRRRHLGPQVFHDLVGQHLPDPVHLPQGRNIVAAWTVLHTQAAVRMHRVAPAMRLPWRLPSACQGLRQQFRTLIL